MGLLDFFSPKNSENPELLQEIVELSRQNEQLAESYSALARATLEFDEKGWAPINQFNNDGVRLEDVKVVSRNARRQAAANPLLKRGAMLRASYVFGRGFKMSSRGNPLPPRYQAIIDDPINQQVLFSEDACKKNERALFTDGNFFVRYDRRNRRFGRIPLDEIAGWATDPDDPEIIRYYLREYMVFPPTESRYASAVSGETRRVWYPSDIVENPVANIDGVPVDRNFVVIDHKENVDAGSLWGLPDCLPAMPWAWAYSEYLKDGSKMLKALSSIAWQVKSKSAKGAANVSAKLLNNRQVAATAVTGADVEMSALPRNNSVDLDTGRPLAAMAATAMEVSTDALLAGAGSSSAGAQVLDQSTLNAAYARQGNWESFFIRVLRVLGVPDPSVAFNNIIVDPSYRTVQSLATAWMTGLFSAETMQAEMAEQLGIEAPGSVPSGVLVPNNTSSFAQTGSTLGSGNPNNVATSQGNSGPGVDDLSNGDNTLRDIQDNPR